MYENDNVNKSDNVNKLVADDGKLQNDNHLRLMVKQNQNRRPYR